MCGVKPGKYFKKKQSKTKIMLKNVFMILPQNMAFLLEATLLAPALMSHLHFIVFA